jgi:hypothetical protein
VKFFTANELAMGLLSHGEEFRFRKFPDLWISSSNPKADDPRFIVGLYFREHKGGNVADYGGPLFFTPESYANGRQQDGQRVWVRAETGKELEEFLLYLETPEGRAQLILIECGLKGLPKIKSVYRVFGAKNL